MVYAVLSSFKACDHLRMRVRSNFLLQSLYHSIASQSQLCEGISSLLHLRQRLESQLKVHVYVCTDE
jgi:hypothetical protein